MRIIALMLMVACGSSKETSEETEVTSELKELRVEPAEIQLSTDGDLFASCASRCYTHAVQVELSLRLRKHLTANKADRDAFAAAIVEAARVGVVAECEQRCE